MRRPQVPIGMVVEGDEKKRVFNAAKQERRQMVKISRAAQHERFELCGDLRIKVFRNFARRSESKPGAPRSRVNTLQSGKIRFPGAIEVEKAGHLIFRHAWIDFVGPGFDAARHVHETAEARLSQEL